MSRIFILFLLVLPAYAQLGVGNGAPNEESRQRFIAAFNQSSIGRFVSLPPIGPVRGFGPGYIQEFADFSGNENNRSALVQGYGTLQPDGTINDTFAVLHPLFSFYNGGSVGVATAGLPAEDTNYLLDSSGLYYYTQRFSKSVQLFSWVGRPPTTFNTSENIIVQGAIYSAWLQIGGLNGLGPAVTPEIASPSNYGTSSNVQHFLLGAVALISSGTNSGRAFTVRDPIYKAWVDRNAASGLLGLPTGVELTLPDGRRRQNFEGGSIEYRPMTTDPAVVRLAVSAVLVEPATSPQRLNLNDTLPLQARMRILSGEVVTDRDVAWTTSNSRVATVTPLTGGRATLTAVGGGTALISATSEGKTSTALTVIVTAPCCAVGEGAPTAEIAQSFQDAVSRLRIPIRFPGPSPVRRAGAGYVQEHARSDNGQRVVLAKPDSQPQTYALQGAILTAYEAQGGFTGSLGYPVSDATAGGRQMFENRAALAGSPVLAVSGAILDKWSILGYETGGLGSPLTAAIGFLTFSGASGLQQAFRGGTIYSGVTGAQAGRTWFVYGLIATRYFSLGGPTGRFGMPLGDEITVSGRRRQEFEGGTIEYAPGDAEATATERPRRPQVSSDPATVVAGNKVRVTVGGFEPGVRLRVSVLNLPDFQVSVPSGSYSWEIWVPSNAASGVVPVRAVQVAPATPPGGTAPMADGGYRVRAIAEVRATLTAVRGDLQTGVPGSILPLPLRVRLADETNQPLAGIPVRFTASPGSQALGADLAPLSAPLLTDVRGEAEAYLRLPAGEGIALVAVEALRTLYTFNARAQGQANVDFPGQSQDVPGTLGASSQTIARKGALLAAAASVIRFHQQRGELPQANGLADTAGLNAWLRAACVPDPAGAPVCDGFVSLPGGEPTVNLLRLANFVGGQLEVVSELTGVPAIRDRAAAAQPVIIGLAMTANGLPGGSHFVVATGTNADGSVRIFDPNPNLGRTNLTEYLNGFLSDGWQYQGTIVAAIRLVPKAPLPGGFFAWGSAAMTAGSSAGACATSFQWPATAMPAPLLNADILGQQAAPIRFVACSPGQTTYQLELSGAGQATLSDTNSPTQASRIESSGPPATYKLTRPGTPQWLVAPMDVAVAAGGVVN
ncbi:MAG: hypothetical protein MUC42_04240, partial [Bryobacter sp.]|nr:hypothetical protein [Bryobacter sp.]